APVSGFRGSVAESADGRGPDTGAGGDCRWRMALDAQKRPCFASDRRNRLSHNCTPACVVGQAVSPVNPVTLSQARDPGNRAATESRKPSFRPPLERSGDPQISPTRLIVDLAFRTAVASGCAHDSCDDRRQRLRIRTSGNFHSLPPKQGGTTKNQAKQGES